MAYELPLILCVVTVIIKSNLHINLGYIVISQIYNGAILNSISGFIAFIVAILCMQAKLGLVPFDVSEAEQEIMSGVFIDYSGFLLAIFKLMKSILIYIMPILLISLFWASNITIFSVVGKYIVLLVIIILIKNTSPRFRIDQVLRFFWGPITLLAMSSVILALMGK